METSSHPPRVERLHYELEGWLGDDLLESFPVYVVTRRMGEQLEGAGLSGFILREVEVSRSTVFEELYPDRELPQFRWLEVTEGAGEADFGLDTTGRLVVSAQALEVLRSGSLENCRVTAWQAEGGS